MTTTMYYDINNSFTTSGNNGTSAGTPRNWTEFNTDRLSGSSVLSGGGTFIFKLIGERTDGSPGFTTYQFAGNNAVDLTIDATDITSPWRIALGGTIILLSNSTSLFTLVNGAKLPTFKNGIINMRGASGENVLYVGGGTEIYCYNMIFECASGSAHFRAVGAVGAPSHLKGCTIILPTGGYSDGSPAATTSSMLTDEYIDCIIKASARGDLANTHGAQYTNCVFTGASGGFGADAQVNCQYSWTPNVAFPATDYTVTGSISSSSYLEQTLAPDGGAHDITISSTSSPWTGYETGLFGGQPRSLTHGIGGLYFGPILLYFRSTPSSVIPSSRKFIYQPIVTGDTVASWTITTMPAGMTLNGTTGRIEWTPLSGETTSGSLTLTAHSTSTGDIAQTFTLAVDTAPRIVSTPPDVATNGSLFNYQPVVVDAENNVSGSAYTLVNPPSGMTISATTGLVSWTPSSTGTFHFTLKVTDSNGLFDAQMVTLVVT